MKLVFEILGLENFEMDPIIIETEQQYFKSRAELDALSARSLLITQEIEYMGQLKKSIELFEKIYYTSRRLKVPER